MSLRVRSLTRSRSRSSIRYASRDGGPNKLIKSHPSTRSSSPTGRMGRLSRRTSKVDLYLSKSSRRNSAVSLALDAEHLPTVVRSREIKRWDGVQRMTTGWDSLRRDPELWLHNGDCLIHLYEKGSSRRGASLRVSLGDIESSDCRPFLNAYQPEMLDPGRTQTQDPDRRSRFSGYFEENYPQYEMFIPAPSTMSKDEALQFHLTTRNFFAWMYNRPLVGDHLGQSFIRLQGRMDQYRPHPQDNQDALLGFYEDQGYLDFRHCADHALAVLQYAEHYQLRELWTDAFVHCAGMNDELDDSCEYENISRASQALIIRAHIEMDIRLERAGRALETFLEGDIPGEGFKFDRQAYMHLDRFRTFLQYYYVGRYGYWPPALSRSTSDALPKGVYQSMYFDLRNLYEYLSDKTSSVQDDESDTNGRAIDVAKVVSNFDKKHKFGPLIHPQALLPKVPEPANRRKSIWNVFGHGQQKKERRLAAFAALKAATNHNDHRVMSSNIVREYLKFERDWAMIDSPNVNHVEARKARWLLVYGMLQTLISVAKVPEEVKDTEGVTYPLCCQTAGTPPWPVKPTDAMTPMSDISNPLDLKPEPLNVPTAIFTRSVMPKRSSLPPSLPLNAPQPLRSASIEFLAQTENSTLLAPPAEPVARPMSVGSPTLTPLTTTSPLSSHPPATKPTISTTNTGSPIRRGSLPLSDPSTPSSTELSGNGGWSASSSEDDMDHSSVTTATEGDSNYGDDEGDGAQGEHKTAHPTARKLGRGDAAHDLKRAASGPSMKLLNPEVDQFLSA